MKNTKRKKAVVARDCYDDGYDVTMVQRSSTLALTGKTLIDVTMKGLYAGRWCTFLLLEYQKAR